MQRILSLGLMVVVLAGILYACNLGGGNNELSTFSGGDLPALGLSVQHQGGIYNAINQTIPYQYNVTNTGGTVLTGPVIVTDSKTTVTCKGINEVGDLDADFDPGEVVTCTSIYTITQADLNTGSVTSTATASANGVLSNTVTTAVDMTPNKILEVSGTATPTTYNNASQAINFSFVIRNTGSTTLGPAQFTISDARMGTVNCLGADTTLTTGASISCSGNYTITESDRTVGQLSFNLVASGGGATNIQPVQVTITNTNVVDNASGNYTTGQTVKHDVKEGEWLVQIARCYGADITAVINANRQLKDPAKIWPGDVLTIPNIGSNGKIYGPKDCVIFHTAQSGDTWDSIAKTYNARVDSLKDANLGISNPASGVKIRVPRNSAGGTPAAVTPVPPGPVQPIRLDFSGVTEITRSGSVIASKGKDRYVFTAVQGQRLEVILTPSAGGLELSILPENANVSVMKPQNDTLIFAGNIPSNGDYFVDVVNVTGVDKPYSLKITLYTPSVIPVPELAININPGSADGNPSYLAVFNNALYFSAIDLDNAGMELRRYEATSNSLLRVKDIFPGPDGSNPSFLTEYNGFLYFSANGNDGAGVELWRYNGVDAGRLTDINTGSANANPSYLTVYKGFLYFSALGSDGAGVELWRTDGTTTVRVTDIYEGSGDANPSYLAVYNDVLYFSATSNDGHGTEIWKFDGTNAARVTDINPNVGNANPAYLEVFNNILYFSANANDGTGTELWQYNGNIATRAADINPGSGDSVPTHLTVFSGALYFSANANDGVGYELWKFDGTDAKRVSDINKSGDSFPSFLTVYDNHLYFQANGGDGNGKELWRFKP